MTIIHGDPPEEGSVYLDEHHAYRLVKEHDSDNWAGITEFHWTGDHWCAGFVPFKSHNPDHGWDVISLEPLHLEPSLLCRLCGSHGWIRSGAWFQA